jgi:hypothetical protein
MPVSRRIETSNEVEKRRLPRTAGSDDSHQFTGTDVKGDAVYGADGVLASLKVALDVSATNGDV